VIYISGQVRWQLEEVYIASKRHELWPTNGVKLDLHFYASYSEF